MLHVRAWKTMINGGIRHVMKVNFVALIFPHYFYLQCTHSVFAWLIREYKLYNLQIPFIYCKHIDCLLWNATEHDVHVLHVWHRDSQKNVRYCTWTEQALALHCFSYATVCGAEVSCVVTSEKILPPPLPHISPSSTLPSMIFSTHRSPYCFRFVKSSILNMHH